VNYADLSCDAWKLTAEGQPVIIQIVASENKVVERSEERESIQHMG